MFVRVVRNVVFLRPEKPGTFGVSNQILRDTGTELLKIHTTGTYQGKSGRMWSLLITHHTIEVGKIYLMVEV